MASDKMWVKKSSNLFELVDINGTKYVSFKVQGRCDFRIGVSQHIVLHQHPLR